MNALIRKELRSILPAWAMAMALAVLPVWLIWPAGAQGVSPNELGLLVFAPFIFGVLVLSLTPFGQELNWGTLSVLLAQPVARRKLWLVKTLVLGTALLLVFAALFISNQVRVDSMLETMKHTIWRNAFERVDQRTNYFLKIIAGVRHDVFRDTFLIGGLAVLTGFAGGLWTTLLVRQVTAAFWLTVLTPLTLILLTGKALGNFPEPVVMWGLVMVLAGYSAGGFIWAKRLFFQAQDTQWTGGIVSLAIPEPGLSSGLSSTGRTRKMFRALLSRELQGQFINLLLAAGILVLHLGVVAVRKLNAEYLAVHRSVAMTLEAFPVLWLTLPLLIGSVAVAEERKNGTLSSSLCLPASRRLQFSIRLLVAMILGVICGGVIPLLIERFAAWLGLGQNSTGLFFLGETRSTVLFQLFAAAGITGLAFYGSTLARNTLQAIGLGLLGCLLACLLIFLSQIVGEAPEFILWRGRLIGCIGLPVMVLTWFLLTYRNFQHLQLDSKLWRRNLSSWLFAIIGTAVVTTCLYHRAWEAWLPEEPVHRPFWAIVAPPDGSPNVVKVSPDWASRAKIRASGLRTAVVLPDGRLWLRQTETQFGNVFRSSQGIVAWGGKGPTHTGFVEGSNWKDVAVTWNQTFGIRRDGTLWNLSAISGGEFRPQRVGQSHDWVSLCAGANHFCALQRDGTLWHWGKTAGWMGRGPAREINEPAQIGTDTDWSAVCSAWDSSAAFKNDGTVWRWNWASPKHRLPEPWLVGPCSDPISLSMNDRTLACVCPDGTLWLGCDLTNSSYSRLVGPELIQRASREMVRWRTDSDWKEIHWVGWGKAVGIKRDGSLWEWNTIMGVGAMSGWVIPPTIPSQYMDWLCAGGDNNAFLALARDGTLCLWGDPDSSGYFDHDGPDRRRWLMPSRIKAHRVIDFAAQR